MLDGRKYVLNLNAGIIFGNAKYPENVLYYDNAPAVTVDGKDGIGMLIHLEDVEIDPVIVMDKRQAKELIKALRVSIRRNKHGKRKWKKHIRED